MSEAKPRNCDTCAHDYHDAFRARCCVVVDRLFASDTPSDDLFVWVEANVDGDGAPMPGADGCPDYAEAPTSLWRLAWNG